MFSYTETLGDSLLKFDDSAKRRTIHSGARNSPPLLIIKKEHVADNEQT